MVIKLIEGLRLSLKKAKWNKKAKKIIMKRGRTRFHVIAMHSEHQQSKL